MTPPFQRFITRLHRRYVLMHVVEHGTIGLLIGAVAGILLTAMMIWRGLPTESIAIATLLLGLALGLMQGASSRPKRMEAATRADQQLQLAELLGSALTVSDGADWASIIRSQADAVCGELSPSDVILHRLGVRVWGGAGLASVLLCALALIPTSLAGRSMARQSIDASPGTGTAELIQSASLPRPTATQADPDSVEHSRFGDNTAQPNKSNGATASADPSDGRPAFGAQPSAGSGATSADASDPTHLMPNALSTPAPRGHTPGDGSGRESADGIRADSAGSATVGNLTEKTTPPWKTAAWPAQIRQVQSDLRTGHIPDAYRDMIGGYFDSR